MRFIIWYIIHNLNVYFIPLPYRRGLSERVFGLRLSFVLCLFLGLAHWASWRYSLYQAWIYIQSRSAVRKEQSIILQSPQQALFWHHTTQEWKYWRGPIMKNWLSQPFFFCILFHYEQASWHTKYEKLQINQAGQSAPLIDWHSTLLPHISHLVGNI